MLCWADQVTETADFQKDLSLDSLDRMELVMAFEQEFSIEIPDEQADKLTCCANVARYITSQVEKKKEEKLWQQLLFFLIFYDLSSFTLFHSFVWDLIVYQALQSLLENTWDLFGSQLIFDE